MNEPHPAGKRARSALSEEQFAQASLALIQRWRLALATPACSAPASFIPSGSAVAAMSRSHPGQMLELPERCVLVAAV